MAHANCDDPDQKLVRAGFPDLDLFELERGVPRFDNCSGDPHVCPFNPYPDLRHDLRVGLVLLKFLESAHAVQSAEAALSEAAFLELVSDQSPGVAPDRAGARLAPHSSRPVNVAGPDRRGEAVLRDVGKPYRVAFGFEDLEGRD